MGSRHKEVTSMRYLANSFSINMIPLEKLTFIQVEPIKSHEVPGDVVSCVGHADTAKVLSNILGREVVPNRVSISLTQRDILYVAQYSGPRLPEGATELPEGATIRFYKIGWWDDPCGVCHEDTCEACLVHGGLFGDN